MSAPGMLVEYFQSKRLICALCLKTDNKDNLFVRTEENREDKVARSKVVMSSAAKVQPHHAPEEIASWLKQAGQARDRAAAEIALEELWELLAEEQAVMDLETLAGLCFTEKPGPEQLSGLYRALSNDRLYFVRKGNDYLPRTLELVRESQSRLKAEQEKAGEREHVGGWLKQIWSGDTATVPEGYEKSCARYLTWIRETAVLGPEAPRFKDVQALFKQLDIGGKDAAFRMMVKSGQWSEDEFVSFHRVRPPTTFTPELVEEAGRLAARVDDHAGRLDLSEIPTITVDDEDTTEIDDALSLETLEDGGFRVGVHIADASHFIDPGSLLDQEAIERGTDIYLPEGKTCLFPEVLSEDAMSLVAGKSRLAFSYLIDFNAALEQTGARMAQTVIRVDQRLTYDQMDTSLDRGEAPDAWVKLREISEKLRALRQAAGAITLPFPRASIKVVMQEGEPQIKITPERPDSPAQLIVSEMMILANRLSAQALVAAGASAIFRSQEPPDIVIPADVDTRAHSLFKLRRHFRRGSIGLEPARHSGLGLDAYLQATSPIRRFADLVAQRQLKSTLTGGAPFYNKADLGTILALVERNAVQAEQLERERKQYWTLRYLEQRRWAELDAVVLQNLPDKHLVQIVPVLYETDCPLVPGRPLPPGTPLKVRIELVWPREQTVRVTPVLDDPD